jgi:hypothetical protein
MLAKALRHIVESHGGVTFRGDHLGNPGLKHLFNVAIADGKADVNPVKAVKLFKENNQRVRFLANDVETALRNAIGEEEWPIVAVAIHTGLRHGGGFGGGHGGGSFPGGREFGRGGFGGRPVPHEHDHDGRRIFVLPYFYSPYYGYDPLYPGYLYNAYCDPYSPYYAPQYC